MGYYPLPVLSVGTPWLCRGTLPPFLVEDRHDTLKEVVVYSG